MFSKQFIEFIESEKQFKAWSKEHLLELQAGKKNLNQQHCDTILRVLAINDKTDLIQELFNYMKLKDLNISCSINIYFRIKNLRQYSYFPGLPPNEGITHLIHAFITKKYERAILLLSLGADPNMGSESGVMPLEIWYHFFKEFLLNRRLSNYEHQSEYNTLMRLFKILLEKGADPLQSSPKKRSILFDFIAEFTAFMAEYSSQPLYFIDFKGIYELMKALINIIKDIERVDEYEQMTILSFASLCGCSPIAQFVHDSRQANPCSVMTSPYLYQTEIADGRAKLDMKSFAERNNRQDDLSFIFHQDSGTAAFEILLFYKSLSEAADRNHRNLLYLLPLAKEKIKEVMVKEDTPKIPTVLKNMIAEYAAGQLPRKVNFKKLTMG